MVLFYRMLFEFLVGLAAGVLNCGWAGLAAEMRFDFDRSISAPLSKRRRCCTLEGVLPPLPTRESFVAGYIVI